jgi:hypothetical protein
LYTQQLAMLNAVIGRTDMKTSVILLYAAAASISVSIPLAFASMTFVGGTGSWSDIVIHPGFWVFYGEAILWMFLASFLASVLTLLLVTRRLSQGP